jgi:hypothetical protein
MRKAGRRERRSSRSPWAGAVVCLLAMAANGCSFMYAQSPPPNHTQMRYFDCPSSYAPPALDTAGAVAGGLFSLVLFAFAAYGGSSSFSAIQGANAREAAPGLANVGGAAVLVAVPVVLVGLPAASAVYGYTKVGECRDAKAELDARLNATPGDGGPAAPRR